MEQFWVAFQSSNSRERASLVGYPPILKPEKRVSNSGLSIRGASFQEPVQAGTPSPERQ
jgi:hypothetical protein